MKRKAFQFMTATPSIHATKSQFMQNAVLQIIQKKAVSPPLFYVHFTCAAK
jgi:hypothetical protein